MHSWLKQGTSLPVVLPSKAKHIDLVSNTPPFVGALLWNYLIPVQCFILRLLWQRFNHIHTPSTVTSPFAFSHSLQPFSIQSSESQRRIRIREKWADTLCSGRYSYCLVTKVLLWWPEVSLSKRCPFPSSAMTSRFVGRSICHPHCPSWVPEPSPYVGVKS